MRPARLAEAAGAVDVLVANAALPASGRVEDFDPDEIDRSIDVNLRAPIQLTRALLPGMLERGRGHVVLVSSLSGKVASPRSGLYSATKFGLRGFAAGLREDVEPLGDRGDGRVPRLRQRRRLLRRERREAAAVGGHAHPRAGGRGGGARNRARAGGGRRGAAEPPDRHADLGAGAGHRRARPAAARLGADRRRACGSAQRDKR